MSPSCQRVSDIIDSVWLNIKNVCICDSCHRLTRVMGCDIAEDVDAIFANA